jgi:gliding motility-associated lipoprotein GldH
MRILFFGNKGWLFILVVSATFFSACGDDFIYEKNIPIAEGSWAYEDTLTFDFNITDSTKLYSLQLEVAHSPDYGFQNLYVQMHTRYPSGKQDKQVLSLELASLSGVWNGNCGGKKCTLEIPLLSDVAFPETGTYTLSIEQYMRQSPLPGLLGMSLKIKPVGMR